MSEGCDNSKMEWFKDARLGIFIHWGIYAVNGIDESWSFFNNYISHEDYLKQADGFHAENYDPEAWAELICDSGATYSVITSKHHDGFAMWDSADGKFNATKHSAAGRDLLTPFCDALRKKGIKLGIYYSLPDWSYPDYTQRERVKLSGLASVMARESPPFHSYFGVWRSIVEQILRYLRIQRRN